MAIDNLSAKTTSALFCDDLLPLVNHPPADFTIETAAALVSQQLLDLL